MKHLVLTLLILGSVSAFAAVGEDRASVHDGVMCQEEMNKIAPSTQAEDGISSDEVLEG